MNVRNTVTTTALISITMIANAAERDSISIVGSSTVYPFATVVAEQFGKRTEFKTPKIESTGSGGGFKLFCDGVGGNTPDITNSSRAIVASEVEKCAENGVDAITEVKIGYDGIVIANAIDAELLELSVHDIFLALAATVPNESGELVANPYTTWSEVNADLPAIKIEVLGPPPTSGTRDAFVELVMETGCEEFDAINALEGDAAKAACQTIREDGMYVEAGENDNLIVQKLDANHNALGIFGYSFLEENSDVVKGSPIEGVEPTYESIADGSYPVSRPLYFYVKAAHADVIPGLREYVTEFTSEEAFGEDGYLADRGLISLSDEERETVREEATNLVDNVN